MLREIKIKKEFDLEELSDRIRKIILKGFPKIRIHKNSDIELKEFSPEKIKENIFVSQPRIYRTFLDRINKTAEIFLKHEIDIFKLNGGVDYIAIDESGEKTDWTITPPIIELLPIKFNNKGLDYSELIGPEIREKINKKGWKLNQDLLKLSFPEYKKFNGIQLIHEICDGAHRIHAAFEKNINQNLLIIKNREKGFPYYAAPKPYSTVHIEPKRIDGSKSDKIHVIKEPYHKELYSVFPSGGILSGTVRPD